MHLIPHIILISMVSVGAHLAAMELIATFICDPDYLFYSKDGKDVMFQSNRDKFLERWSKPLFLCPTCMASVWGTTLHFALGGDAAYWIPVVLAVAFTNTLLNKWVSS